MNQSPETFLNSSVNRYVSGAVVYRPHDSRWVDQNISSDTEAIRNRALLGSEPTPLSPEQTQAIGLALSAIHDTVRDIAGEDFADTLPQRTFVSYFERTKFKEFAGPIGEIAAGFFIPNRNQIVISGTEGEVETAYSLAVFTKVFIHEFFHFTSEQAAKSPIGRGLLRVYKVGPNINAIDIRSGREGTPTWDYFLAFNEAITEILAIEAYDRIIDNPMFTREDGSQIGPLDTYQDYRNLIYTLIDRAREMQTTELDGPDLLKQIVIGNLTGNFMPLLRIVRRTLPGVSIKEFGLMTNADDLPTADDYIYPDDGGGPTLSPSYLSRLRKRLDLKENYETDVMLPPPPPSSSPATQYAIEIKDHRTHKLILEGYTITPEGDVVDHHNRIVGFDYNGNTVHADEKWLIEGLGLVAEMATRYNQGEITATEAQDVIDQWLFETNKISELSAGFENFYVLKHVLLDPSATNREFTSALRTIRQKIANLERYFN